MQLGAATSARAAGPYRPGGRLVDWRHERIDPDLLLMPDGSRILYWTEGNNVLAAPFSVDDEQVRGPHRTVLLPIGEEGTGYQSVVEGTWAMRHAGWIYLFTSGDRCCVPNPRYAVSVARSLSPFGPFVRFEGNPILAANASFRGPGHCSIFVDAEGGTWIVYHAMPAWSSTNARMLMIDRLTWRDGWPVVNDGRGPSLTSAARPSRHARGG
jgi:arabinan endo-1,5-alpha-L-arabinosidase